MKYPIAVSAAVLLIFSLVLVPSSCDEASEKIIRVSTGDLPVFIRVEEYDNNGYPVRMSGIGFEYLNWICHKLNLKFNVTKFYKATNKSDVTSLMVTSPNGTWNGALGDLVNNVSDTVVATVSQRPEYIPHFVLTFPLTQSSFSMFGPCPHGQNRALAIAKPFSYSIWALVAVCLFFIPLVMVLLSKVKIRNGATRKQRKITYDFLLLYFLTVITGQGQRPKLEKFRNTVILALIWCVVTIVVANAYKGLLITFLTLDSPELVVSSYSELVTKPELVFYAYNNSLVHYSIMTATEGNLKSFGDVLRKNPKYIQQTISKRLQEAEAKQHFCFAAMIPGNKFVEETFQKSGSCSMARIGPSVINHYPIFLVRKNYTYAQKIYRGIIEARSFGLEQKWTSERNSVPRPCEIKSQSKTKSGKLTLQNLSGAFYLLIFGIVLSSVCLVAEVVVHFVRKKQTEARKLYLVLKNRSGIGNLPFLRKRESERNFNESKTKVLKRMKSC